MLSDKKIIEIGDKFFKKIPKKNKLSKEKLKKIALSGCIGKLKYYRLINTLSKEEEQYIQCLIDYVKQRDKKDHEAIADDLAGRLDSHHTPKIVRIVILVLLQRGILYYSHIKHKRAKTLDWDCSDLDIVEYINGTIIELLERCKKLPSFWDFLEGGK